MAGGKGGGLQTISVLFPFLDGFKLQHPEAVSNNSRIQFGRRQAVLANTAPVPPKTRQAALPALLCSRTARFDDEKKSNKTQNQHVVPQIFPTSRCLFIAIRMKVAPFFAFLFSPGSVRTPYPCFYSGS